MRASLARAARRIGAFVVRDFRSATSYRAYFAMQLLGLAWMIVLFYFVGRFFGHDRPDLAPYGGNWFAYVLLGYAPLEFLRVGVLTFSSSIREAQNYGTLEAVLVTRVGIPTIVFGSAAYDYAWSTLRALLFATVGTMAGGRLGEVNVGAAVAFLALSIACFGAIGILSASFVMVFKKFDPIAWLFLGTSSLFAGLFFPTSVLGRWEVVSRALPLTYAMEGVRRAARGETLGDLASEALVLAGFCAALVPLAAWAFRAAVDRARRDGTLSHY